MRKLRRRRNKKQVHIVLALAICLISIMTVGYAAFSTNISLNAKGNIIKKQATTAAELLKANVVTEGDGLYVDTTESGRYVYKGASPDNYISFNAELWRIVALEKDGTLKVIKNESIGEMPFDTANTRSANYCNNNSYGCNIWGSKTTILDVSGNHITSMPTYIGGDSLALPTLESQMAIYLNTTYYNTLSEKSKLQIDKHQWNIGILNYTDKLLEEDVHEEMAYKWEGEIGLINPTDYVKSSTNKSCINIYNGTWQNPEYPCKNNNYLFTGYYYWTISPVHGWSSSTIWHINDIGVINNNQATANEYVRPALYLKADIQLTGKGTETDPYAIIS